MKIPILFYVHAENMDKLLIEFESKAQAKLDKHKDKNLAVTTVQVFVQNDVFFAVGKLGPDIWAEQQAYKKRIENIDPQITKMTESLTNFLSQASGENNCNHEDGFEAKDGKISCKKCGMQLP